MSRRLIVSREQFESSDCGWDDLEGLQLFVDAVVSNEPPVIADIVTRKSRNVVDKVTGQRGVAVFEYVQSGVPELVFPEHHIDDITWVYPLLSERKIAGPSWA